MRAPWSSTSQFPLSLSQNFETSSPSHRMLQQETWTPRFFSKPVSTRMPCSHHVSCLCCSQLSPHGPSMFSHIAPLAGEASSPVPSQTLQWLKPPSTGASAHQETRNDLAACKIFSHSHLSAGALRVFSAIIQVYKDLLPIVPWSYCICLRHKPRSLQLYSLSKNSAVQQISHLYTLLDICQHVKMPTVW